MGAEDFDTLTILDDGAREVELGELAPLLDDDQLVALNNGQNIEVRPDQAARRPGLFGLDDRGAMSIETMTGLGIIIGAFQLASGLISLVVGRVGSKKSNQAATLSSERLAMTPAVAVVRAQERLAAKLIVPHGTGSRLRVFGNHPATFLPDRWEVSDVSGSPVPAGVHIGADSVWTLTFNGPSGKAEFLLSGLTLKFRDSDPAIL